jgi:hypothetical protein
MKLISRYTFCFLLLSIWVACKSPQKQVASPVSGTPTSDLTEKEELDFAYLFFEASKDRIIRKRSLNFLRRSASTHEMRLHIMSFLKCICKTGMPI